MIHEHSAHRSPLLRAWAVVVAEGETGMLRLPYIVGKDAALRPTDRQLAATPPARRVPNRKGGSDTAGNRATIASGHRDHRRDYPRPQYLGIILPKTATGGFIDAQEAYGN